MDNAGGIDEVLVAAIRGGDEAAFSRLFARHASPLLGFLVNMVRDRELAEEVLQEVFLEVWNKAEKFDATRASVRSWLFLLARSRATDAIRSINARRRREERSGAAEARKPALDPREPLEAKASLQTAIDVLSTEQRECVRLSFFGGLSISEISEQLGIPLGTAKSRYLYAMRKLRRAFVEDSLHD